MNLKSLVTLVSTRYLLYRVLITSLFLGSFAPIDPASAAAASTTVTADNAQIRIVESDDTGMTLVLDVETYAIQNQVIVIPGTTLTMEPGKPRLPTLGALLAIPTTRGVRLDIVETEIELLDDVTIENAPQVTIGEGLGDLSYGDIIIDTYTTAEPVYLEDEFYPSVAVELGETGRMRDLPVTQVRFHPLRYNPMTRQAELYRKTVVRLTWDQSVSSASVNIAQRSSTFDAIYRAALLNYHDLPPIQPSTDSTNVSTASHFDQSAEHHDIGHKVVVRDAGIYSVKLVSASDSSEEDAARNGAIAFDYLDRVSLWHRGKCVKFTQRSAGTDGVELLFYAEPLASHYQEENVYWIRDDIEPPSGCKLSMLSPSLDDGLEIIEQIETTFVYEQDRQFWRNMRGQKQTHSTREPRPICVTEEAKSNCLERWFWSRPLTATSSPWSQTLQLPVPAHVGTTVIVTATARGLNRTTHRAEILVATTDGHRLGKSVNDGLDQKEFELKVATELAQPMDSLNITVTAPDSSSSDRPSSDGILIDRIEVSYESRFVPTLAGREYVGLRSSQSGLKFKIPKKGNVRFEIGENFYIAALPGDTETNVTMSAMTHVKADRAALPITLQRGSYFVAAQSRLPTCHVVPLDWDTSLNDGEDGCTVSSNGFVLPSWLEESDTHFEFKIVEEKTANRMMPYVVVTTEYLMGEKNTALMEQADRLVNLHPELKGTCNSQCVIAVEDIIATYGYGIKDPYAIRKFVADAKEAWDTQHVVLFGDADLDYRENFGHSSVNKGNNLVLTASYESNYFGEIATDNWFGILPDRDIESDENCFPLDGACDPYQDVIIGRIPVNDSAQADVYIKKLQDYMAKTVVIGNLDTPNSGEPWQTRVLLVNDDEPQFRRVQEDLGSQIPPYQLDDTEDNYLAVDAMAVDPTWGAGPDSNEIENQVVNFLNGQGVILVNYIGHGDFGAWGRWDRFDPADPNIEENKYIFALREDDNGVLEPALSNTGKLPFVTVGNCLNGAFAGPTNRPALAERLVLHQNGAIGMWAPTGLGYPSGHEILLNEFYRQVFRWPEITVGEASLAAINYLTAQSPFWSELADMYVLFGDPALSLQIINPPILTDAAMSRTNALTGMLTDQPITDGPLVDVPLDTTMTFATLQASVDGDASAKIDVRLASEVGSITRSAELTDKRGIVVNGQVRYRYSLKHEDDAMLEPGQTYRVTALGGWYDPQMHAINGIPLFRESDKYDIIKPSWNFTTTSDGISPQLQTRRRHQISACISETRIEFSEAIRRDTFAWSVDPPFAMAEPGWLEDGTAIVLQPQAPLPIGSVYNFKIDHAEDYGGNQLPMEPVSAQFEVLVDSASCVYLPALR